MPEELFPTNLGCELEEVDSRDFLYENIALGGPLPMSFLIPSQHTNQGAIDSCVGHAVAGAKSTQEVRPLSPRDLWALCKQLDGNTNFGTKITSAMKALIQTGVAGYGLVNEDVKVPRETYMQVENSPEIAESRKENRLLSFWRVNSGNMELAKQALFSEGVPLITSCLWYKEYNYPLNGFLPIPRTPSQGHCFRMVGWTQKEFEDGWDEVYIFLNSYRKTWGENGMFFLRKRDYERHQIGAFYVLVDMPRSIAEVAAKYAGKLVKTADDNRVYFIERDSKRHIENELAFWLFTTQELKAVEPILPGELEVLKEGKSIKVSDFDPVVLRAMRNMAWMYQSDPNRATQLFSLL